MSATGEQRYSVSSHLHNGEPRLLPEAGLARVFARVARSDREWLSAWRRSSVGLHDLRPVVGSLVAVVGGVRSGARVSQRVLQALFSAGTLVAVLCHTNHLSLHSLLALIANRKIRVLAECRLE